MESVTGIAEVCRVYGEYMAGMRIDARWNRIVVGSYVCVVVGRGRGFQHRGVT